LGSDDTLLIALAGHGAQIEIKGEDGKLRQEGFFCPKDAEQGDPDKMIALGAIFKAVGKSGAGANLLLIDACRDDPTRGGRGGLDGARAEDVPQGVAILLSCNNGQRAYECKEAGEGHGVFFHFVLQGLKGEAKNRRGEVTWPSLVEYVKD